MSIAEIKLFRTFLAVAQSGSMREASAILHVAQSAISRQIVMLEEELGVPLFERLPRGVALTSAGEIFFRHARDSIQRSEKVRNDIAALKGDRAGRIRIVTAETFTNGYLPQTIAAFQKRFRGTTFDVRVTTTSAVVEAILAGNAEFGIAYNAPPNPALNARALARTELAALMRPDHPLASHRHSIALSDLGTFPVALPAEASSSRMLLDATAERVGVKLNTFLNTESVQLRLHVASKSDVVVLVGVIAARAWLQEGTLVALPMKDRPLTGGRVELLTLKGRRLPPVAETFGSMLEAEFDTHPLSI